ncbi:MAG: type I secretion system permease/ATPase [Candidatus Parabeggiatoa sp. nov. 3]|nr:MAG: type I secretion system permease/ATPase [Gammaproteobacteria bacterium]RKZ65150.1 MAG: type I secretion system permease/ATPase [Gammaproteobacteria bacterium]RKZ87265.1 MAG: type I secretion system permease/ATPase [Gammaproteobacteria bacterium]
MTNSSPNIDTGLICLALLARFHHLPADIEQLKHQFGQSGQVFSETDLLRAAKQLGLKAKAITRQKPHLDKIPLPAIVQTQQGHYVVLAKLAEDKVLIQDAQAQRPVTLTREQFLAEVWSSRLIFVTRRFALVEEEVKFGFRWFIPSIVKYRKFFGEVFLASFFIQLFALITPLFFQVIIDKVLVHKGLTTLDVLAIGMLAISFFEVLLDGLRTYLFSHTSNRVDVTLGTQLFTHLLALPVSYFEARRVGNTVARVRELESIRNFITGSALTLVIDLFFTVVFLTVMYYYSPTLTYIVLGSLPFYILLSFVVTPILRERLHEKFNRGAENQAFLVEAINGIETVKASAVEPQFQRRWETQLAGYVSAAFKANHLGNIANQIAGFINKVTTVLILWIGARLVIEGYLSIGQLIAFNMLAGRVSGPVLRLVQLWQDFQQAGISLQRLGDILNAKTEPNYQPNRTSLPQLEGRIHFDQITFRYRPDGPEILRHIDLEIPKGQVVGIVGRSGSGKSTLAKLVQRLHVPEKGRMLIDGVNLIMIHPAWLRRQVGIVLQESFLFNNSVRDNIALHDPSLPMEIVVQAAKMAGAHEFILELTEGYDTIIGEHGSTLSGGQRQRIAIARALVMNPRILIFDEATSALDYESERLIQNNMQRICAGRTVLIIAHRLSTVRHADRIIVIDKGQIVEEGHHGSLVKKGGHYAALYAHQNDD